MNNSVVFCDFDGTISRRDIGYNLFHRFSGGRNDALLPDWKSGKTTTRECLLAEAALATCTPEEVYAFLDEFELNPGFVEFAARCRDEGVPLSIISDGLDFYIKRLLGKHGLSDLPLIANRGYLEDNGIRIEFPHKNKECVRCGSCKGERIREYRESRKDIVRVAFVGDGYSDVCAVAEADFVLAKKDLERYCLDHHIEYVKYDDFYDVARELETRGFLASPS